MTTETLYSQLTSFVFDRLRLIAMAAAATLLAIYGNNINAFVRKATRKLPFLMRFAIFVALCAFGYGMFTMFLASTTAKGMAMLNRKWILPSVAATFLFLGFLAERKRQV